MQVQYLGELLFTEVCNALNQITEKLSRSGLLESGGTKACGLRKHILDLERMLKKEKEEFEVLFHTVSCISFLADCNLTREDKRAIHDNENG